MRAVSAKGKIDVSIKHHRLRQWAYDNAYTLIWLSAMFIVTWVVIVVTSYVI